jgi:CheY-like chemotaxis protein
MVVPPTAKQILVAEDSEDDVFLLTNAFRKAGLPHTLTFVIDGEKAIEQLQKGPCPDLLLLDLKMPRVTGFEVLKWLQGNSEFRGLPVVVYSSSALPEDQARAKKLGARYYVVKSTDYESLALDLDNRFLQEAE